ncbi:MAG TPA: helix-turn-helix transcriptional regulator [Myxococcota bacterium]|nr:helix-turn-helix transcriptional regulator [Myxococcota bacterium]
MKGINKKHIGSSFDNFLEQENLLIESNAVALKRVLAFQLQEAMNKNGLTKSEMAKKMHTSRSALSRFLDPDNISITLTTMEKAATAIGKRLEIKLVRA